MSIISIFISPNVLVALRSGGNTKVHTGDILILQYTNCERAKPPFRKTACYGQCISFQGLIS